MNIYNPYRSKDIRALRIKKHSKSEIKRSKTFLHGKTYNLPQKT